MPDCIFTMVGGQVSLPKKGDQTRWTMQPPNAAPCTVSVRADGDIEVVQVGSDGSVSVKATADNATGTIYVTKECPDVCGPTTLKIHICTYTKPWYKYLLNLVWLTLGVVGAIVGFFVGGPVGAGVGALSGLGVTFILFLLGWVTEPC